MANIASEPRPAIVARPAYVVIVMLAAFALVPWQHGGPRRVIVSLAEVKRPPVIVPMQLYAGPGVLADLEDLFAPTFDAVIEPAEYPDAQSWPRGMVIHPPPFPDQMNAMPSTLDRLLSGLLAPWHSIAS